MFVVEPDAARTSLAEITVSRREAKTGSANTGGVGRKFTLNDDVVYQLREEGLGFEVQVGDFAEGTIMFREQTARWEVAGPLPPRSMFHLLMLDPISLFAPTHGLMVCHGAAVIYDGGAVLLLGNSGAGKSTLSFLLSQSEGGEIRALTDDTFILDFTGENITVWPIQTGYGLGSQLLSRFGIDPRDEDLIQRSNGKSYIKSVPGQAPSQAYRIDRFIFLDRDEEAVVGTPVVQPLGMAATLRTLIDSQTSIANPYAIDKLKFWSRMAKQTVGSLVRYREYCDPAILREFILAGRTAVH
jgi:energy-coupling factor transporter ATP-binding protein EcfA2